jgi:hypothetical protein
MNEIKRLGTSGALRPQPRILGTNEVRIEGDPQILDKTAPVEPSPAVIHVHEEVVIEGQDKVRLRKDGGFDLRFRAAKDRAAWERVKRGVD